MDTTRLQRLATDGDEDARAELARLAARGGDEDAMRIGLLKAALDGKRMVCGSSKRVIGLWHLYKATGCPVELQRKMGDHELCLGGRMTIRQVIQGHSMLYGFEHVKWSLQWWPRIIYDTRGMPDVNRIYPNRWHLLVGGARFPLCKKCFAFLGEPTEES
jgi:hypothetical protein